jgi:Emfourin
MHDLEECARIAEKRGRGVYTNREKSTVHNFRLRWVVVGLVAWLCACRPAPTLGPAATPPAQVSETWRAELTQSGGLLGVDLEVQVTSGGVLTASNRRSGGTASTQLAEAETTELRKLLDAALTSEYAGSPSDCADCFAYELTLASGNQSRTIRLDDATMSGTAAEPLIAYLVRLRDEALAAP